MGWLFTVGKEEEDDEALAKRLEFDFKIRDIKRRIEKLRQNLDTTRPVGVRETREMDEPARTVEHGKNEKKTRQAEMDDLRRKLTGRKK